jgi:hypothetical protein
MNRLGSHGIILPFALRHAFVMINYFTLTGRRVNISGVAGLLPKTCTFSADTITFFFKNL